MSHFSNKGFSNKSLENKIFFQQEVFLVEIVFCWKHFVCIRRSVLLLWAAVSLACCVEHRSWYAAVGAKGGDTGSMRTLTGTPAGAIDVGPAEGPVPVADFGQLVTSLAIQYC